MKPVWISLLALVVAGGAGCASGGASRGPSGRSGVSGRTAGGDDARFAEILAAIEAQNREIAELRASLANQDERVRADVDKINDSLDSHLELLDLLYRQMGQTAPALTKPSPEPSTKASIFGSAAIDLTRGEPLVLKRMKVWLLREETAGIWRGLSSPRTLYNTPIQNADTILSALEFTRDVETPRGDPLNEVRSADALNSHLRKFEESLTANVVLPSVSTRENGKYFFSDAPAGDYQLYARISPETYSVCWLIPVRVEVGAAQEVNLDAKNAKVFLNDLQLGGN